MGQGSQRVARGEEKSAGGGKLSDALVRSLPAPEGGAKITYDGGRDRIRGFGIRVTAAGAKAFVLNYTVAGRERRMTIGGYPAWSVATAREEAKRLRQDVDRGVDPLAERIAEREAPTVNELCDRYIAEHAVKKRTGSGDEAMIRLHVRPALGNRKVASITYTDVDRLHRELSKGLAGARPAPYQANRLVALLSKMFALSIRWEMRTDNPTKGVERNPEEKRKTYLQPKQIARLSEALAAYPDQNVADAIRLLLLTGARRGEVLGAHWQQFDLEAGQWVKPAALTKQKAEHEVPLSAPAIELLARRREIVRGDFVFPGRGTPHLTEIKKGWASLRKAAGLEGVRIHDLRHTAASVLVSGGASLPMIGALLGHTQVATTNRYAHLYSDPLRAAAERLGAVVTAAADKDDKTAEVVPIGRGRGR